MPVAVIICGMAFCMPHECCVCARAVRLTVACVRSSNACPVPPPPPAPTFAPAAQMHCVMRERRPICPALPRRPLACGARWCGADLDTTIAFGIWHYYCHSVPGLPFVPSSATPAVEVWLGRCAPAFVCWSCGVPPRFSLLVRDHVCFVVVVCADELPCGLQALPWHTMACMPWC